MQRGTPRGNPWCELAPASVTPPEPGVSRTSGPCPPNPPTLKCRVATTCTLDPVPPWTVVCPLELFTLNVCPAPIGASSVTLSEKGDGPNPVATPGRASDPPAATLAAAARMPY